MDFFGIGQAMKSMARVYKMSSRATGRTISMLESVKDGDRIVFVNTQEADRVSRMCRERELDVECIVIPVVYPGKIFERGTSVGRTIFDHSWVEEYYLLTIERAEEDIDFFERQSSGYGEAHRETHRKAMEISKWQF